MAFATLRLTPIFAVAVLLGACASDGNSPFSTASVVPAEVAKSPAKAKTDPACVTLASQIDRLRKEGTIERLEKVAAGKGDNVQVKRTALAKQAELNKANAEFQAKCAPKIPASQDAKAPMAAPTVTAAVAAPAAAAAVAKAPVAKAVHQSLSRPVGRDRRRTCQATVNSTPTTLRMEPRKVAGADTITERPMPLLTEPLSKASG